MAEPSPPSWWVTKPGTGRPVVPGDVVLLHARAGYEPEEMDDEANTFLDSRPSGSFEVPLDEAQLLPEVFTALVGRLVGTVLVIPVSGADHDLSVPRFSLEVEIVDVRERAPEAVHRIATHLVESSSGAAPDPDSALLAAAAAALGRALNHPHRQRNGFVVTIGPELERAFAVLADRVVGERAFAPPLRIRPADQPNPTYLVPAGFIQVALTLLGDLDGPC